MGFSVEVTINQSFNNKVNVDNYKKAMDETIKLVTYEAEDGCINECPVRTGFLRDSHYTEFNNGLGRVMNSAEYAHDVIYGTRYSRSNDYPQRVLNSMKTDYSSLFRRALLDLGVEIE